MTATIYTTTAKCPDCGEALRLRRNRESGSLFLGCSGYPSCRHSEPYDEVLHDLVRQVVELEEHGEASRLRRRFRSELRELVRDFHPSRNPNGLDPHVVHDELERLHDEVAGDHVEVVGNQAESAVGDWIFSTRDRP